MVPGSQILLEENGFRERIIPGKKWFLEELFLRENGPGRE